MMTEKLEDIKISDIRGSAVFQDVFVDPIKEFNKRISGIQDYPELPNNFSINHITLIISKMRYMMDVKNMVPVKIILKALNYLFYYLNRAKNKTVMEAAFKQLFELSQKFPDVTAVKKSLAILLIYLNYEGGKYLPSHLLSIPGKSVVDLYNILCDKHDVEIQQFALMMFVPSVDNGYDMTEPIENSIFLPDPALLLRNPTHFTIKQFIYAEHVLQICHALLSDFSDFNTEWRYLELLISHSEFTRACLCRALYVAIKRNSTSKSLKDLLNYSKRMNLTILIEELFLYNYSESFLVLIEETIGAFYPYFRAIRLNSNLKFIITAYDYLIDGTCQSLIDLNTSHGYELYLNSFYISIYRILKLSVPIKYNCIRRIYEYVNQHVQKIHQIRDEAENICDPAIDSVLCCCISIIYSYYECILFNNQKCDRTYISDIYNECLGDLHYLMSIPCLNKGTVLAYQILESYHSIMTFLQNHKSFRIPNEKPISPRYISQAAMIYSVLFPKDYSLIKLVYQFSVYSDDPTIFYSSIHLMEKIEGYLTVAENAVIQTFFEVCLLPEDDSAFRIRTISRVLLIMYEMMKNKLFLINLIKNEFIFAIEDIILVFYNANFHQKYIPIYESSIYFFGLLYNVKEYKPSSIFPFHFLIDHINDISLNAISVLIDIIIAILSLQPQKSWETSVKWGNILNSKADNISRLVSALEVAYPSLKPKSYIVAMASESDQNVDSNKNDFSFPWIKRKIYSNLIVPIPTPHRVLHCKTIGEFPNDIKKMRSTHD